MLESDAQLKLCPMGMGREYNVNPIFCAGSHCMAWQEKVKAPVRVKDETGKPAFKDGVPVWEFAEAVDPPAGDCGMIPPELYCEGR